MTVYLDNSATTKQYDDVTSEMTRAMKEDFGNPSSLHRMGFAAEQIIKKSREDIANAFGANANEIYFNSGGTEGANSAFWGVLLPIILRGQNGNLKNNKIITTRVEHPAVLRSCDTFAKMGFEIVYLNVDDKCRIDIQKFENALDERTALVSIMAVNNEVGTIMPINKISKLIRSRNQNNGNNIIFHTDAVQALGKIDVKSLDADIVTVSGHKIHGPKGIGFMYKKNSVSLSPFIVGGGQEFGMRSGTENTPSVVGMSIATIKVTDSFENRNKAMGECREYLLNGIKTEIDEVVVNSAEEKDEGVSAILNVSFVGAKAEVLLHMLEQDGIYVSTGSACSSGSKGNSHVLEAMGLDNKIIDSAIRFSFSEFNDINQMEYVLDKIKTAVNRIRKTSKFR